MNKTAVIKKQQFDGSLLFGVKGFNIITNRGEHLHKAKQGSSKFFIDPKTKVLYRHMREYRRCPVCGVNQCHSLFLKGGFRYVKCVCGFIFINPTARGIYRDKFFSETYKAWNKVLSNPKQMLMDRRKYIYGLQLIKRYIRNNGLLVDIGAGIGVFLKTAKDAGWKVSGVEFNKYSYKKIKKMGIEVFDRGINEGIYARNSVDAVTLWEVLEHINHPNRLLQDIRAVLKPKGVLFICVPNAASLVTRMLHEKSNTFTGCSHVSFFSIPTLSALLEKHRFHILYIDTIISEIGTIKNHLSFEDPYYGNEDMDCDFLTPSYIYKHKLGSRIVMLCRKIP